jgi:hypothetical protein
MLADVGHAASTFLTLQQQDPYSLRSRNITDAAAASRNFDIAAALVEVMPAEPTLQSLEKHSVVSNATEVAGMLGGQPPASALSTVLHAEGANAALPVIGSGSITMVQPLSGSSAVLPSQAVRAYPGHARAQNQEVAVSGSTAAGLASRAAEVTAQMGKQAGLAPDPAQPPVRAVGAASSITSMGVPHAPQPGPNSSADSRSREGSLGSSGQGPISQAPQGAASRGTGALPAGADTLAGKRGPGSVKGHEALGCRRTKAAPCKFFILVRVRTPGQNGLGIA